MRTTNNNKKNMKEANQLAFQYALYMMLGSYFNSAKAKSPFWEDKLYLYYCETGKEKQYQFEDLVLRFVESKMKATLPQDVWDEDVKVYTFTHQETTYMVFEGARYKVYVQCKLSKKRTRMKCKCRRTGLRVFGCPLF